MYYFKKIDVSDIEPFDGDQSINFSDGLTLITDKDGSGNRTIHNTLRKEFNSVDHVDPIAEYIERYPWLVFFDKRIEHEYGYPSIVRPWKPLTEILSSINVSPAMHKEFESNVTKCIRQILSTKVQSSPCKFNRWIKSSDELYASVSSEGAINVYVGKDGINIYHCFEAMGEQLILYIAIIYAVRKLLSLELPFVSAYCSPWGDQYISASCSQFFSNMSKQTIVLEYEPLVNRLGSEAAYQIISHPDSGKSVIELQLFKETIYIFLDIDGVLNLEPINNYVLDKDCLTHFENAIRSLGDVKIVISSSWRLAFSLKKVRQHFSDDIKLLIVGFTPAHKGEQIEYERYYEVLAYLKRKNIKDAKWIAIDDSEWHYPKKCSVILTESTVGFNQTSVSELRCIV